MAETGRYPLSDSLFLGGNEGVLEVTINRPERRNAIDEATARAGRHRTYLHHRGPRRRSKALVENPTPNFLGR